MGEIAQSGSGAPPAFPVVRAATFEDVRAALSEGWRDFKSAPAYGLFFGGIYALGGLLVVSTVAFFGMSYLAYPLAAGFVLIGPFIAAGLYEVSRRLEKGEPLDWRGVIGVIFAQADANSRGWRLSQSSPSSSGCIRCACFSRSFWASSPSRALAPFCMCWSRQATACVPRRRACRRRADGVPRLLADGDLVSAAARPRRRFHHGDDRQRAGCHQEPGCDARLGVRDRRHHRAGERALLPRPVRGAARAGHATWRLYRRIVAPI